MEALLNRPPGEVLLEEVRLIVAGKDFPLRHGLVHGSRITWRSTGLSWTAGDKVSVMVTDHSVVSNLLQDNAGQVSTSATAPALAQSFTTGSHPSGYTLSAARLPMAAYLHAIPTVSVYSNDSGVPGESLHRLSRRPWFWFQGFIPNDYLASDFPLEPDTRYWLVAEKLADKRDVAMLVTVTDDEDPGAATGWSLGNAGQMRSNGEWSPLTGTADTIQMAILAMKANRPATGAPQVGAPQVGEPVGADTADIVDPDGLTGVSYSYQWMIEDKNGRVADIPGATGSHFVPRSDDLGKRLRVRVFFNDDFGHPEELASGPSLPVGILISNHGAPVYSGPSSFGPWINQHDVAYAKEFAQPFTTGSQAGGYSLHSVLLSFDGYEHATDVSIYSDNNGAPGTSLHTLTGPASVHGLREFTATDFTLQSNTKYWLMIKDGYIKDLAVTMFTEEDEGARRAGALVTPQLSAAISPGPVGSLGRRRQVRRPTRC